MPFEVVGRVDRAHVVGDLAEAVLPHADQLVALLLGHRRQLGPDDLLGDAGHMRPVLDQVRHVEQPELRHHGRHDGRGLREIERAELQLLQHLLIGAELARAVHVDLGLIAQRLVDPLGPLLGRQVLHAAGIVDRAEVELERLSGCGAGEQQPAHHAGKHDSVSHVPASLGCDFCHSFARPALPEMPPESTAPPSSLFRRRGGRHKDRRKSAAGGGAMARAGRRPRRDRAAGLIQAPARQLHNPYPPFEILSADQIETIHQASLRVLAEIGVNFLLPEARDILKQAGAEVEQGGARVRFDPSLVEERIRSAPAQFTLHARNPERNVAIGGSGDQFLHDRQRAARLRSRARPDHRQFRRLLQSAPPRAEPERLPHDRGLPGRADRPAARDPPSRRRGRHGDAVRQDFLRLCARRRADPRFARDRTHRAAGHGRRSCWPSRP